MRFWCTSKKLQICSIVVAVVTIVTVLSILFIHNWPSFARQKVIENLIFKNGTLGMQRFQNTSDLRNLRLSFSVYSVTNVDQVIESGAKMKLKEYGPFVYHEFKWKEILDNDQEAGLITYKLRRRFIFKPEFSVGDPANMTITWLNVPLLSAISFIDRLPLVESIYARAILNRLINRIGETAFITDTVENFIFTGSYRELFEKLYENYFIRNAVGDKWPLPDNKFAILYKRNNNWRPDKDYIFTTSAGFGPNQNYTDLNQYKLMNGSRELPFWKKYGDCNKLSGTDGEFFRPFLEPFMNLSVYSMDICRKLPLKFRHKTLIDGISVYLYSLDEKSMQSVVRNPDNECYSLSDDGIEWNTDGLIDLSTCVADNVYASGSHFLYGSPELLTRVAGIRPPNKSLDEPLIYVEPNTGLSVQVRVPIQFNVKLEKNSHYSILNFFQDDNPLIVPLVTITESAELENDQATMLREKLLILDSWFISMVLGGAIVLILVTIVVITILCMKLTKSRPVRAVPNERDPLLSPSHQRHRIHGRHRQTRHQPRSRSPSAASRRSGLSTKTSRSAKNSGKSPS